MIRLGVVLGAWLMAAPGSAQFTDASAESGLDLHRIKDGGATWADFDADGWLDVLVNTANDSFLYFSNGDTPVTFTDVTATHAPGLARRNTERAAVAGDLNNDGLVDFARTHADLLEVYLNRGPEASPPYRFGNGSGDPDYTLDRSREPGLTPEGLGIIDYDRDGWLDILADADGETLLLANPRDGSAGFLIVRGDVTGLPFGAEADAANGDYLAVTDFDVDGYVDAALRNTTLDKLFRNAGDGTFASIAAPTFNSGGSRRGGNAFCDFDNDGDFDFFFTTGSGTGVNHVWLQTSPGVFEDSGAPDVTSTSVDGVACGDVDNDGDVDLFLTRSGDDLLLLNQLDAGALAWVQDNQGITGSVNGEGTILVDYDRDGDLDVFIVQTGNDVTDPTTMVTSRTAADNELWRNELASDAYLAVRVLAEVVSCPEPPVRRDDHGAVVSLRDPDSGWQSGVQEVNGGMGHGTQGSPILHFGLPMGASLTYEVTLRFQHPDEPEATVEVTPASLGDYQLLTVVASDPDGDSIPTARETSDAMALGDPDPDGDGRPAWLDPDADGDGILDAFEAGDDDPCTAPADEDGNSVPDYLEPPRTPTPDGGVPPGVDGGLPPGVDGGPVTPGLGVRGSGFARCALGGGGVQPRTALVLAAGLLLLLWRRRR